MNKAVWLARRNYWIAGIGAIVSAFSFFVLPFFVVTVQSSISLPIFRGNGGESVSTSVSAVELAFHEGLLWLSLLLILAVLGLAILFLARQNPFGSNAPIQVQARWTAWSFVAAGVLSALCLVISLVLVKQELQIGQNPLQGIIKSFVNVDAGLGIGGYLFLAGLVAIVVAGIMEAISPVKALDNVAKGNAPQSQYPQYPPTYGSTSMGQGSQSFTDATTQYRGNPTTPYQPPSPPYGQ
jgi:hypothetical protein